MRIMRTIMKMAVVILATASLASAALITTDKDSDIVIAGPIESGDSARLLVALSETIEADVVHLTINSRGGSGSELWTMLHLLENKLEGRTLHTYGYGIMYSAGAILFLAGDVREMSSEATIMLHFGTYNNEQGPILRNSEKGKAIPQGLWDRLDRNNEIMWNMIKAKTTLPKSYLLKERFLSAEEALKFGVATKIKNLGGGKYVKEISSRTTRSTNDRRNSVER